MELLDIYDENGIKTGRQIPRGAERPDGVYILVTHLCVFDGDGRMLIQQRDPDKDRWGGVWDVTVGGHVSTGEDSLSAVLRETREELGFTPRGKLQGPIRARIPHVLDDFYLLREDVALDALTLQKGEVSAVRWADCREVMELMEKGAFIDYDTSLISDLFARGRELPVEK